MELTHVTLFTSNYLSQAAVRFIKDLERTELIVLIAHYDHLRTIKNIFKIAIISIFFKNRLNF